MSKQLSTSNAFERFYTSFQNAETHYRAHRDRWALEKDLTAIAREYGEYMGIGDLFIYRGELLCTEGDLDGGMIYLHLANAYFPQINNRVTLYLRLAQHELEKGNTQEGTRWLTKLCTESVDNYEEVIAQQELTDVWERYRHLVEGTVPKSLNWMDDPVIPPLAPDECSMQIDKIFELPESELLTELSIHIEELSGNGSKLSCLNRWERTVYDVNRLIEEIASGGFLHYLYYHGTRFEQTKSALKKIGATKTLLLLQRVEGMFPGGTLPTSLSRLQDAVDEMEEDALWEQLDEQYYDEGESELISKLYAYVLINRRRFR